MNRMGILRFVLGAACVALDLVAYAGECGSDLPLVQAEPSYAVHIPSTEFSVGAFELLEHEVYESYRKFGFRRGNCVLLLLERDNYEMGYHLLGPVRYGKFNEFLFVNYGGGGSSGSGLLLLFDVSGEQPELLDAIATGQERMRGIEVVPRHEQSWHEPMWVTVEDLDGDGSPDIEFTEPGYLVLTVKDDRLTLSTFRGAYARFCERQLPPWEYGFCQMISRTLDLTKLRALFAMHGSASTFEEFVRWIDDLENFSNVYSEASAFKLQFGSLRR